ncbi:MAG TPA: BREX system ATP-binding domain-containing protein [Candidatus Xenobia bacterium]|jgi:hypothetical protein
MATIIPTLLPRRVVEALRSGVPSAAAVRSMGTGQAALQRRFEDLLETVPGLSEQRRQGRGLMVRGGFGEGKSHLLTCFEQLALDAGFAVSRVVISKETPLNVPAKFLRSAVENLRVPQAVGRGLEEIGVLLRKSFGTPAFVDLMRELSLSKDFDTRFAATLEIYQVGSNDEDLADRVLRFWSGDPLTVSDLKRYRRELGLADARFEPIRARELALHTMTFLPRLMQAAGLQGWVLLIDELELIGRYSRLARGQSYAELARWLGIVPGEARPGLFTVGAITADFVTEVLRDKKKDLDDMAPYLAQRDADTSKRAERGMKAIQEAELLVLPSKDVLADTYATLRRLHGQAYQWMPPEVQWPEALGATPMRTFVRAWINAWDVRRLYPDQQADAAGYELDRVRSNYDESSDLGGGETEEA